MALSQTKWRTGNNHPLLLLQSLIKNSRDDQLLNFAGPVIKRVAGRIQHHHVRNVAAIIFFDEFLLGW